MAKFSFERNKVMRVGRVIREEDRTLLYESVTPKGAAEYHIIAKKDCEIKVGDVIEYEPYGLNFGWLIDDAR